MALIPCKECKNIYSSLAHVCPKCGAPTTHNVGAVQPPPPQRPVIQPNYIYIQQTENINKEVGVLLFFGILLMPYIFVWILFLKGYSGFARIAGGLWLIFVLLFVGIFKEEQNTQRNEVQAAPTETNIEPRKPPKTNEKSILKAIADGDTDALATKNQDANCIKDISCWGERHSNASEVYCPEAVENIALYSSRWTNSWIEPKFSAFKWLDQNKGFLTYVGDKIEFQNGFGAFQGQVYECDFDPVSKSVLAIRVNPRHL